MSDPLNIPAIRERWQPLLDAASPRPWKCGVYYRDGAFPIGPYSRDGGKQAAADAALMATVVNDAEALLTHLAAVEVERDYAIATLRAALETTTARLTTVEIELTAARAVVEAARVAADAVGCGDQFHAAMVDLDAQVVAYDAAVSGAASRAKDGEGVGRG